VDEQEGFFAKHEALQRLVVDNPELEHLEKMISGFNVFEAIGVVRQELKHSDFLAFLLEPRGSHGLGDAFAKRLLQAALPSPSAAVLPVTPWRSTCGIFEEWRLSGSATASMCSCWIGTMNWR
jgi:hypothetical protein